MHTIRYVVGDSVFFPALKKFVTSPKYTYDNLVNTDDVEQFFSQESGRDLKPLFDLFLRSVNKLEVHVKQINSDHYLITMSNMPMTLPVDITTDAGTRRTIIDQKRGAIIMSKTEPVIDRDDFYLKRVIFE